MKNIFTTLILSALFVPAFGQSWYSPDRVNSLKHTKESLGRAEALKDLLPRDPSSLWVKEYSSISISATCDGKILKSKNKNELFTEEQKNILKTADLNTSIALRVVYNYQNPVTDAIETSTMNLFLPVVPEKEAEFPDGPSGMAAYLKENVLDKFKTADTTKKTPSLELSFTVDEDGKIANTKFFGWNNDPNFQKVVLEAFNKMPKWSPATNSKGIKVKQEFRFYWPGGNGKNGC
jgi:hypothetical protein